MTVTLITGANKGIGYETVRQLIALGHTVYLGARDEERGKAAADTLGARFVQLDVRDDASVAHAVATVSSYEEHLDVLINNADMAPATRSDPMRWRCSTRTLSGSSASPRRSCLSCKTHLTRWS